VLALDQASKFWLLRVFDIGHRGAVKLTPFLDLGAGMESRISFGWFQNDSPMAQIILMLIKALAVIILAIWMARSRTLMATIALGLIIGGAVGNAVDRFAYGAVVDFALFMSRSRKYLSIGTCLTLPMSRLLPELRRCCMIHSWDTRRKSALIPADTNPLS